jgi:hypothetical protein
MLNKSGPMPRRIMRSVGIAPNIAIFIVTTQNNHRITQCFTLIFISLCKTDIINKFLGIRI